MFAMSPRLLTVDRLLVTGSRDWTDAAFIEDKLTRGYLYYGGFILVQGDCPTGADAIAKAWAVRNGYPHEDVPADWERDCDSSCYHKPRFKYGRPYCPMAGHLRNQVMVDRGADVCLAFPIGKSFGTRDCIKRAEAAGIEVKIFEG